MKKIKLLCWLFALMLVLTGCFDIPIPGISEYPTITPPHVANIPDGAHFQIHYLDVGQGDSALVMCDGVYMLIDGGSTSASTELYSYFNKLGIEHLDYVVATHGHEDHIGGLTTIFNKYSVGTVLCSVQEYDSSIFRAFVTNAERQGLKIQIPQYGDSFALGGAKCTVLGPISYSEEHNNMSLVLRIEYGNTSFLFTGDAELDEEREILDAGFDVSCDVLKVGHHGSESSTSYRFLRACAPQYAVISVGNDNDYGHPHEDPLSRLRDAEVEVYRTDMQGTIICVSDGASVRLIAGKNAGANTLEGSGDGGNHNTELENRDVYPYVVNTRTMKFHLEECESVADMSENNRGVIEATRDELIIIGYEPCGRCKP